MYDQNNPLQVIQLSGNKVNQGQNMTYECQLSTLLGYGINRAYVGVDNFGNKVAIKEHHNEEAMKKEIQILEQLNHPNIVQYLDSCNLFHQTNQYHSEWNGYICMELGIYDLCTYKQKKFSIGKELVDQMLSALAYLQKQKIAHCDIKPQNILVMQTNPIVFKICDFASSKLEESELTERSEIQKAQKEQTRSKKQKKSYEKSFVQIGTNQYMSPEMINKNVQNYYLSDVFSLGLVFLYVFRDYSLNQVDRELLKEQKFSQEIQDKINENEDDIQRILNQMIQFDPQDRLDFVKLLDFWNQNKKKVKKQEYKLTPVRMNSTESRFLTIQQIQNQRAQVFRLPQLIIKRGQRNQYSQHYQSSTPQKDNLTIDRVGHSYSKPKKLQQLSPSNNYFIKPPKTPLKSKTSSPTKSMMSNKLQQTQHKEEKNTFSIKLIQGI
ncbi:unnamed protein product (macronuclear) [Paramecium tetraurelia]|uniref:Protein kinase domain-containing protein n=1 Tax=Paramecium tetraurelia TaxID=5888 RepID=A0BFW1_PARTE|nr:uncharacterized protein GSPATT00028463001 [Paramecium tetraurelia]CAK57428.1 unnamed protein product [Paramecium tetraurelia]|eukprot:XP_001424826.1 hypothetical protein (macronuclear) [Paramecium tetraurelia strain d4-2]